MKRSLIVLGTLLVALYLGSVPASAQRGSRPTSPGMSGTSHGPSSHASSTATGSSTSAGPKSADSLLTSNNHLATHLASALVKSGALPAGSTSSTLIGDCAGFRNLGRCISAIHVAHNRNINFFCLREELTGNTTNATGCPTGTTANGAKSLGQAIQKLDPNADPKVEASKGIKQANADIKSAKS
jgi:hypothetical protein